MATMFGVLYRASCGDKIREFLIKWCDVAIFGALPRLVRVKSVCTSKWQKFMCETVEPPQLMAMLISSLMCTDLEHIGGT